MSPTMRSRSILREPVRRPEEVEVLVHRHLPVQAEVVRHKPQPPPHDPHVLPHVLPEDPNPPHLRPQQRADQLERRRLPRPVRPDKPMQRPRPNLKRHPLQRPMVPKRMAHFLKINDGGRFGHKYSSCLESHVSAC